MFIEENEIKKWVSLDETYELSKQYLKHEIIESIEVMHIGYDHFYSVKAVLEDQDQKIESFVALSEKGRVNSFFCNCHEGKRESACAHVGAVLMKLEGLHPKFFPFYYRNDQREQWDSIMKNIREEKRLENQRMIKERSESLLEQLKKDSLLDLNLNLETQLAHLEMTLVQEQGLHVSLRVGKDTFYIVKDIREFLRLVDEKATFRYGQKLNLNHDIENFDELSQKQIKFLNHLISEQSKFELNAHNNFRLLPLSKQSMDAFFSTYEDLTAKYKTFKTEVADDKLEIMIESDESGDYLLSMDDDRTLYPGNKHLYHFNANTLTRHTLDSGAKALTLITELNELEYILVGKDSMSDFVTYILMDLNKYLDFAGDDITKFIQESIQLNIYGDINEMSEIYLRLEAVLPNGEIVEGYTEHELFPLKQLENLVKTYSKSIKGTDAIFDDQDDQTYEFLGQGLAQLSQVASVYVSDAIKAINMEKRYPITVGVRVKHNLLELDLDAMSIPKDELVDVLRDYQAKKRFHRLKNGDVISLNAKEFEAVDELMENYNLKTQDLTDDAIFQVPTYRLFSVDDAIKESDTLTLTKEQSVQDLLAKFKNYEHSNHALPKHFESILRDYQVTGYQWFKTICDYGFGGILADDMGLGKTVQMIAVMESMKGSEHPSIVICPSSILLNWSDEIEKFSKDLKSLCIMGNKMERDELIASMDDYDVIITSYDYLRRDIDLYESKEFELLVLDEAQYIKNHQSVNAKSVKKLNGKYRFALTGTPIENTLAELWSIFDFLMPGYLYDYGHFTELFERPIVRDGDLEAQARLKKLIEPFILRRLKKDVLKELPDKIETNLKIEFSKEEKKLYYAHLAQVNEDLKLQVSQGHVNQITVLSMLTKLRQICCEPRILFEDIGDVSSKMLGAIDLIETLRSNKQKILLFSSFTSVLDLLAQELKDRGISYYSLTGSTPKETRRDLVSKFQVDDTEVFLISLKAGGTGINLTSAQAVIHFDPWWNVSAQNQATDRAYRIGQDNNVQVFKLIMKDSIEEKIIELQEKKQTLSDAFVEGNDGVITKMNTSDIISLFDLNEQ